MNLRKNLRTISTLVCFLRGLINQMDGGWLVLCALFGGLCVPVPGVSVPGVYLLVGGLFDCISHRTQ